MINSGEQLTSLVSPGRLSTNTPPAGVGDKITLPLVPLVASAGPRCHSRQVADSGSGTLDKLESIRGWRASLSNEEMLRQLGDRWRGDLRTWGRASARGQEALRIARRDRNRRVDAIDRLLDHEQEDR